MYFLLVALIHVVFSSPIYVNNSEIVVPLENDVSKIGDAPDIPPFEKNSITHSYAVDISEPTSRAQMECLKLKGYKAVFMRGFKPFENGSFDAHVVKSIFRANEAGLGAEVFMTPKFNSNIDGEDQLSLLYQGLLDNGIEIASVWIQVTSPANWPGPVESRIRFLKGIIQKAKEYGLIVGIYTSVYDWDQITNNWEIMENDILLWYWHVLGAGADAETKPNLDDFRSFGSWNYASVKQFAQMERLCEMTVNRNVYPSKIAKESQKARMRAQNSSNILIGSILY